jgi:protocatechuate 3,4-dioxygenase beta subunit
MKFNTTFSGIFSGIFALVLAGTAQAQMSLDALPKDKYLAACEPTPDIIGAGNDYPGKARIVPSNKPALPAGKSIYSDGEIVYLSGRVLDRNCIPISDAIIELWQTNSYGRYVFPNMGSRVNPYPVFAGSGRAITDNLGRYNFVTVFPGPYESRAPHIHIKVLHPDFATLNTEIFFRGDKRNGSDTVLRRIALPLQDRVMANVVPRNLEDSGAGLNATLDITLKGQNKFRRF